MRPAKKWWVVPVVVVLLLAGSVVQAEAMGYKYYRQHAVRHGGHYLAAKTVARHYGLTAMTSGAKRCYGYDAWKKGYNTVGIVIWTLHDRTYWCGIPGLRIVKGSVSGEIRTWTGPLWETHDTTWQKRTDEVHPRKGRVTEASATMGEGANGYDVMSETVSRTIHVYANGVVR